MELLRFFFSRSGLAHRTTDDGACLLDERTKLTAHVARFSDRCRLPVLPLLQVTKTPENGRKVGMQTPLQSGTMSRI